MIIIFSYECQIINYFLHRTRDNFFLKKIKSVASKFWLCVQYCLSDWLINQTLTAPKSGEKSINSKFSARSQQSIVGCRFILIYLRLFNQQTNKSLDEYKRQKSKKMSMKAKDDTLNLITDSRKIEHNEADYKII